MRTKLSLLVACFSVVEFTKPVVAEITQADKHTQSTAKVSSTATSQTAAGTCWAAKAQSLEIAITKSKLCKNYPSLVKVLDNNKIWVASYADRRLSDKEIKVLALNIAKLICANADNVSEVKVRLYDPASDQYWRDTLLNADQIQNGLGTSPVQQQSFNSIEVLNNLGLTDSPTLESRVSIYKRILKLKHDGLAVQPYLLQLGEIEIAVRKKQDVDKQISELNAILPNTDSSLTRLVSVSPGQSDLTDSLEQTWKDACEREKSDLQAVEQAEQEQNSSRGQVAIAGDLDAQSRYDSDSQAQQSNMNKALAKWHEATQNRDLAYAEYMRAKNGT